MVHDCSGDQGMGGLNSARSRFRHPEAAALFARPSKDERPRWCNMRIGGEAVVLRGSRQEARAPQGDGIQVSAASRDHPLPATCSLTSAAAMRDQLVEKTPALLELGNGDELVGLVGLVDRAWPDHHRRDAGLIEKPGLRAESALAVLLLAGEMLRQASHIGFAVPSRG